MKHLNNLVQFLMKILGITIDESTYPDPKPRQTRVAAQQVFREIPKKPAQAHRKTSVNFFAIHGFWSLDISRKNSLNCCNGFFSIKRR